MKTLSNPEDREEIIHRLRAVGPTSPHRWGRMSSHHDGLSPERRIQDVHELENCAACTRSLSPHPAEVGGALDSHPVAQGVQNGAGAGSGGRRHAAHRF